MAELILASGSEIRATLLRNANVPFRVEKARVDEETIRASLLADAVSPRDIADALAEAKALRVSARMPDKMVLGCDQIAAFDGHILTKPETPAHARTQLGQMRGTQHKLFSAAVIAQNGKPIWRHVGQVRLTMRDLSDAYLDNYVTRNWSDIRHCVGGYMLEAEGVRLFSRIEGDYFNVLGLPLIELLSYLGIKEVIET